MLSKTPHGYKPIRKGDEYVTTGGHTVRITSVNNRIDADEYPVSGVRLNVKDGKRRIIKYNRAGVAQTGDASLALSDSLKPIDPPAVKKVEKPRHTRQQLPKNKKKLFRLSLLRGVIQNWIEPMTQIVCAEDAKEAREFAHKHSKAVDWTASTVADCRVIAHDARCVKGVVLTDET